MKDSKLFSVNLKDILNGLAMAVLTPAVFIIEESVNAGILTFDWTMIWKASLAGAVGYIIKKFFNKPSEPKKEVE